MILELALLASLWHVETLTMEDPISGDFATRHYEFYLPPNLDAIDCWTLGECKRKVENYCESQDREAHKSFTLERTIWKGEETDVCSGSCVGTNPSMTFFAFCTDKKPEKPAPVTGLGTTDGPDPFDAWADPCAGVLCEK